MSRVTTSEIIYMQYLHSTFIWIFFFIYKHIMNRYSKCLWRRKKLCCIASFWNQYFMQLSKFWATILHKILNEFSVLRASLLYFSLWNFEFYVWDIFKLNKNKSERRGNRKKKTMHQIDFKYKCKCMPVPKFMKCFCYYWYNIELAIPFTDIVKKTIAVEIWKCFCINLCAFIF